MNREPGTSWWRHPETGRRMVTDRWGEPEPGEVYVPQNGHRGELDFVTKASELRNLAPPRYLRVLRPAKLYEGLAEEWEIVDGSIRERGPRVWWVEAGEVRPPELGERYVSPDGMIRTAEKEVGYRPVPILTRLPPEEHFSNLLDDEDYAAAIARLGSVAEAGRKNIVLDYINKAQGYSDLRRRLNELQKVL